MLTHANCFWTNLGFDLTTGVHGDDVVLQVLPQFHVGGWNVQALLGWWKGARVSSSAQFDAGARAAPDRGEARHDDDGRAADLPRSSRSSRASPTPTSRASSARSSAARRCPRRCSRPGRRAARAIVQGYGLTEAAPNVLCLPPEDAVRKLGYAGKPYPFVDVRLSDDDELQVRGPNVFPRLLAECRGDGGGVHRRRLAPHRRRRRVRRRGLLPDQGAAQGHVHLRRRERLSGRGRGCAARAPAASPTPRSSASPTSAGARSASRSSSPTASPTRSCSTGAAARLARFKVPKSRPLRRARSRATASARSRSRSSRAEVAR